MVSVGAISEDLDKEYIRIEDEIRAQMITGIIK